MDVHVTGSSPPGGGGDDDNDDDDDDIDITEPYAFTIEKGSFIIQLEDVAHDKMSIFVPCGEPNPETDETPEWVQSVLLNKICMVNVEKLPFVPSVGSCSKIDKGDNYFIARRDQFEEGDFILFNGEKVEVYAISVDFNSDLNNCVRIKGEFKRNHRPQNFKIKRIRKLQGRTITIDKEMLSSYRPFVLKFINQSKKSSIGTVQIHYHNFCFNSLGYLTHDTAQNIIES